jgi:hypothetical protein
VQLRGARLASLQVLLFFNARLRSSRIVELEIKNQGLLAGLSIIARFTAVRSKVVEKPAQ